MVSVFLAALYGFVYIRKERRANQRVNKLFISDARLAAKAQTAAHLVLLIGLTSPTSAFLDREVFAHGIVASYLRVARRLTNVWLR